jgi:hypothetical protein
MVSGEANPLDEQTHCLARLAFLLESGYEHGLYRKPITATTLSKKHLPPEMVHNVPTDVVCLIPLLYHSLDLISDGPPLSRISHYNPIRVISIGNAIVPGRRDRVIPHGPVKGVRLVSAPIRPRRN